MGLIKRLQYKLTKDQLTSIVHGIILSHIKYCMSVYTSVRLEENEPKNTRLEKLQIQLNNVARMVNNVKREDHISRNELLKLSPWISLNHQSAASVLTDTWRVIHNGSMSEEYSTSYARHTRAASNEVIKQQTNSSEFIKNGIKLLNDKRFEPVKHFDKLTDVKKHIKNYVANLPF